MSECNGHPICGELERRITQLRAAEKELRDELRTARADAFREGMVAAAGIVVAEAERPAPCWCKGGEESEEGTETCDCCNMLANIAELLAAHNESTEIREDCSGSINAIKRERDILAARVEATEKRLFEALIDTRAGETATWVGTFTDGLRAAAKISASYNELVWTCPFGKASDRIAKDILAAASEPAKVPTRKDKSQVDDVMSDDEVWDGAGWVKKETLWPEPSKAPEVCNCYKCLKEVNDAQGIPMIFSRMAVCDICGNKRCPHATDHLHACTGSNEPGQEGSRYGKTVSVREG